VVVEGRVQGVGFRVSCESQARAFGVAGSVRNLPDGRVEAVFEGDPDAVAALVVWTEQGPAYARVSRVHVVDEEPLGEQGIRIG
jgi:acylphosphatase